MSVRVEPDAIAEHLTGRDFAYVLTVRDGRPHAVAQRVVVDGAAVTVGSVSESLARRVDADSAVTLLWPPSSRTEGSHADYSLIADGDGSIRGGVLTVVVTRVTLHRPAT